MSTSRSVPFVRGSILGCVMISVLLANAMSARGEYSYQIEFDAEEYRVLPGSDLSVIIRLVETVTGGDVARLAPGQISPGIPDGLVSAGFTLDYQSNAQIEILDESDIVIEPSFRTDFESFVLANFPAELIDVFGVATDFDNGFEGFELSTDRYGINLATVKFRIGSQQGLYNLSLQDLPAGNDDTIFADDFSPDSDGTLAFGGARVLVSAVPEPTSIAALGLGTVGMIVRRRRRA